MNITKALHLAGLVLCAAAFRACAGDAHAMPSTMPATMPSAGRVVRISIDNFSFSPAVITVPAGGRVVWVNHDDVPHTVTATNKSFTSSALDTDEQYSRVFPAAGQYDYYCAVHPHMTGKIIVK